jgi:hypothetical protein
MRKSCVVFLTLPDQAIQAHCDTLVKFGFTAFFFHRPRRKPYLVGLIVNRL